MKHVWKEKARSIIISLRRVATLQLYIRNHKGLTSTENYRYLKVDYQIGQITLIKHVNRGMTVFVLIFKNVDL